MPEPQGPGASCYLDLAGKTRGTGAAIHTSSSEAPKRAAARLRRGLPFGRGRESLPSRENGVKSLLEGFRCSLALYNEKIVVLPLQSRGRIVCGARAQPPAVA